MNKRINQLSENEIIGEYIQSGCRNFCYGPSSTTATRLALLTIYSVFTDFMTFINFPISHLLIHFLNLYSL